MKVIKFLFTSMQVAIVLMGIYATVIGIATFIENDYGTAIARSLIYDRLWFELLNLYLAIVLIGSMIKYKPYKRGAYGITILHIGLVVVVLGAGITRYFGFEGMMHIRNGATTNQILTTDKYISVILQDKEGNILTGETKANINPIYKSFNKSIKLSGKKDGKEIYKDISIKALNVVSMDHNTDNVNYKDGRFIGQFQIDINGEKKTITLPTGEDGIEFKTIEINGNNLELKWDSIDVVLPFSIKLIMFDLQRYSGSMSPSSYASDIEVLSNSGTLIKPYRIYMNHVLDYDGYRFFQSSYDRDEKGTILSVNNDPGKWPTYIAYAMLILGSIMLVFSKKGRMAKLSNFLKSQKIVSVGLLLAASLFSQNLYANSGTTNEQDLMAQLQKAGEIMKSMSEEEILNDFKNTSSGVADDFSKLQVQGVDGRIEPVDTLSYNLMRKITGKDEIYGLNPNQMLLGMLFFPDLFKSLKIIPTKTARLRELLGVDKNQKYVSFMDAFNTQNAMGASYKLYNYTVEANEKKPNMRDEFDKDLIKFDEKINLFYMAQSGSFLKIFPIKDDSAKDSWLNIEEILNYKEPNTIDFNVILQGMFAGIIQGIALGDYKLAKEAISVINNYQHEVAPHMIISPLKLKAEIFLNHNNLFSYLILPYLILGFIIFIAVMIAIFTAKAIDSRLKAVFLITTLALIVVHTTALGLRWYISGHSPWSNAYESMLYISLISAIAGTIFFRYMLALSTACILAGVSLFVANLGFMDPQITNLVPVLKSYWLNIHVSIIISSYGFFGLNFLLGILTLILFSFRSKNLDSKLTPTIYSITAINEMAMTLGLLLLLIGNFLGGVWANESWGRYWGWDPKETWTLVSIGIYAIVLHLRLLNPKNIVFIFAVGSMISFYSILMTYFGVNYYLSGMHSYAAGESMPIPTFVYVFLAIMAVLIFTASRHKNLKKLPL